MNEFLIQIIMLLLGGIISLGGALLSDAWKKRATIISGLAVVAIAIVWMVGTRGYRARFEFGSVPTAQITSPEDEDIVPYESVFKGVYKNIPAGGRIWLYIYAPVEQRYYFDQVVTFDNGTWEAANVIMGREDEDRGALYEVGVVVANPEAHIELSARPDGRTSPPAGVETTHEIRVYRR